MIYFLLSTLICGTCSAADEVEVHFNETAARTGDVMTMLSFVALGAIAAFIIFIVVMKSKRNKDSHE